MVFLIFCSLIFVFPFYTMIMMSTYYSEDIYKGIPLLPGGYLLENLKTVFSAHFEVFYINSLITAVSAAFLSVTAYAVIPLQSLNTKDGSYCLIS